jgi:hypothetical protein
MDKEIFLDTMRDLWGDEIDLQEAWETYNDIMITREMGNNTDIRIMESLTIKTEQERLYWREKMAEQGIEMTPIQVDQYISIIEYAMGI